MVLPALLFIVAGLLLYVYYRYRKQRSFWADRGVPHVPANFRRNLDPAPMHMARRFQGYYQQFKDQYPFCGIYFFTKPVALAIDLELL
ncbi:hypothetical protein quinque_015905, partial [Culex quinquefasciatus]